MSLFKNIAWAVGA